MHTDISEQSDGSVISTLLMDAAGFSEMSVNIHHTASHDISGNLYLCSHCHENFKFHKRCFVSYTKILPVTIFF
jgi:hypothetical protein